MKGVIDRGARSSQRGAVIIHVAIALLALIVFSAFVVDYGVMWVARIQAQAAADAGALAAALTLANCPPGVPTCTTEATAAAQTFGEKTAVWGEFTDPIRDVVPALGVFCPPSADPGSGPDCVRVDVFRGIPGRNTEPHTNTLPTFFARMVGIASQGVRATATAQAAVGNSVGCLQPYIIPDKWAEGSPPWTQVSTFDPIGPPADAYVPPSSPLTTGFTVAANYGMQLILKTGGTGAWSSGWAREIDFGLTSGDPLRDEIESCSPPREVTIYDPSAGACNVTADANPAIGCVSIKGDASSASMSEGIGFLISQDPTAMWNSGKVDSPMGVSPRVVPVALLNTQAYYDAVAAGCGGATCVAQVVNILGVFVEGMCGAGMFMEPGVTCSSGDVVGRIVNYPAAAISGSVAVIPGASFLKVARLVQ